MGVLSKILGAILSGVGGIILFFGFNADPGMSYIWLFIGILVMSMGFSLLTGGRKKPELEPPPPTITEIHCTDPECDFKELRDFEKDDYILKPLDAKCPKCGGKMIIEGVYIVREEDETEEIKI
jgi:hypothetical protein